VKGELIGGLDIITVGEIHVALRAWKKKENVFLYLQVSLIIEHLYLQVKLTNLNADYTLFFWTIPFQIILQSVALTNWVMSQTF